MVDSRPEAGETQDQPGTSCDVKSKEKYPQKEGSLLETAEGISKSLSQNNLSSKIK